VRDIRVGEVQQAVRVYDTAERSNPAHAELFKTQFVSDEGDANEMRRHLMAAFSDGMPINAKEYRGGAVLDQLAPALRERI
jgi:hypothetical protein